MLWMAGCAQVDEEADAPIRAVHPFDMVTATAVKWETDSAVQGRVEYGPTAEYGFSTPLDEAGKSHSIPLLGLYAGTWHYRVVNVDGDEESPSEDLTFQVDEPPDEVPRMDVEVPLADPALGPWFLSSIVPEDDDGGAVALYDAEGRPSWYVVPERGIVGAARLDLAAQEIIYLNWDPIDPPHGQLVRAPLDGSPATTWSLPEAHHEFIQRNDGGFAVIMTDVEEVDGETIAGDRIVEVSPDGSELEIWNAFDSVPIIENGGWTTTYSPGVPDWTHGNGLAFSEDEGCYYLSMFWPRQVLKIRRSDGEVIWRLDGSPEDPGDFDFGDDRGFGPQHAPEVFPEGIRLFDNSHGDARVVEYTLGDGVATRTWDWRPPGGSRALVFGDVTRFEGGSALTAWGDEGTIYAIDAAGEITWKTQLTTEGAIGQLSTIPALYP